MPKQCGLLLCESQYARWIATNHFTLSYFHRWWGTTRPANQAAAQAYQAVPDYCFPSRLEELVHSASGG